MTPRTEGEDIAARAVFLPAERPSPKTAPEPRPYHRSLRPAPPRLCQIQPEPQADGALTPRHGSRGRGVLFVRRCQIHVPKGAVLAERPAVR
jgi:hypothetical protein